MDYFFLIKANFFLYSVGTPNAYFANFALISQLTMNFKWNDIHYSFVSPSTKSNDLFPGLGTPWKF